MGDEQVMARLGSMVAYQGQIAFEHAGSGGGESGGMLDGLFNN